MVNRKLFVHEGSTHHKVSLRKIYNIKLKELNAFFADLYGYEKFPVKTVFVCGCGHSGTSLLFGKLSRHKHSIAFNYETGIFKSTSTLRKASYKLHDLNLSAQQSKENFVLEKTPKHIHTYKRISKVCENFKFIIIQRNPLDTIASMYKRFGDLEYPMQRYLIDNRQIDYLKTKQNVCIVKYEELVSETRNQFLKLFNFLEIKSQFDILEKGPSVYNSNLDLHNNMILRKKQVQNQIEININTWRDKITIQQANKIVQNTSMITNELGYLYDSNLNLIKW